MMVALFLTGTNLYPMKKTLHPTYLNQLPLLIIAMLILAIGCSSDKGKRNQGDREAPDLITDVEPVERDFAEIKQSGVLRMITYYSSNTYFLNQGIEVGFEYELVKEFARENDLALEVVIVGADENPFDLLNSGEGDVIAANYTITPERRGLVDFTRPYNLVEELLVFSTELSPIAKTIEELVERQIPISVRRNSSYYTKLTELQEQGYDLNIQILPNEL